MSMLAASKSNSTANKPKLKINGRQVGMAVGVISVLVLGFAIFQIYSIFQQALDTKPAESTSHNNFFDKKTIDEIQYINQNKNNITIPEGRITPFDF